MIGGIFFRRNIFFFTFLIEFPKPATTTSSISPSAAAVEWFENSTTGTELFRFPSASRTQNRLPLLILLTLRETPFVKAGERWKSCVGATSKGQQPARVSTRFCQRNPVTMFFFKKKERNKCLGSQNYSTPLSRRLQCRSVPSALR